MEILKSLHEKYPRLSIWAFVYSWPIFLITIMVLIGGAGLVAMMKGGILLLAFAAYIPALFALGYLPAVKKSGAGTWVLLAVGYIISGTILFYYYALLVWGLVHGPVEV